MEKFRTNLLLWGILLTFLGIGGLTLMCGCGSTQTAPPVTGDGNVLEIEQDSTMNNPWPYVVIVLGLTLSFFSYLWASKKFIGFGRT